MDLRLTQLVRVVDEGLKVAVFSVSCSELVRVAGKGLSEEKLTVQSLELRGERRDLNAEAQSAQRFGKRGKVTDGDRKSRRGWGGPRRNMKNGSTVLAILSTTFTRLLHCHSNGGREFE